jgi:hypothetical protein
LSNKRKSKQKKEIMKATQNKSARTYTLRVNGNKYRTFPMTKQEFENAYYHTENDWNNFLKGNDYYKVK